MQKVSFSQGILSDLSFLADVLESVLPLYNPLMPGAFEKQIAKYRTMSELPQGYDVWIIEDEGVRVGFLGVTGLTSDVAYLAALYIYAEQQGKGYGGIALERCCERLIVEGFREVVLFAHEKAEWAICFYLKHGFQKVTNALSEICSYQDSLLAKIAFPRTVLMRKDLMDGLES